METGKCRQSFNRFTFISIHVLALVALVKKTWPYVYFFIALFTVLFSLWWALVLYGWVICYGVIFCLLLLDYTFAACARFNESFHLKSCCSRTGNQIKQNVKPVVYTIAESRQWLVINSICRFTIMWPSVW